MNDGSVQSVPGGPTSEPTMLHVKIDARQHV